MKRKIKQWWRVVHKKRLESAKLKFVKWFSDQYSGKYCWADCVMWAYNATRFNPYKIDKATGCAQESIDHDTQSCYCGGWNSGQCWDLLSKKDQDAENEKRKIELQEVEDHLPF